ncbi:MAG: hypothetical protein C4346_18445, partial [Chloroflexota bacterium]
MGGTAGGWVVATLPPMVVARRQGRRRLLVLAAVVVTVVAILTTLAGGSGNRGIERRAWLDQLRPVVERSNELGAQLADLRGRVTKLDRPTLTRRLVRLRTEGTAVLHDATAVDAPAGLVTPRSLLLAALAIRAGALGRLEAALDAALGTGPVGEA